MKKSTKTVITYVCGFFFCLCFIIGMFSMFLYSTALSPDKYMERIDEEEYEKAVLSKLYDSIEDMGDVITISEDDIYALVDKKGVVRYSKSYAEAYITSLLNGESFSSSSVADYSIEYMRQSLKELVEEFYKTSEESFSEEEFSIIFDYVETQINGALEFLPPNILQKTNGIAKHVITAKKLLSILRFALIPAFLLLAVVIIFNFKDKGKLFYRAGSSLFIPSAILFIPTALFDGYNLGGKVVLAKSPLSIIFSSVVDTVVKGFKTETLIFFILSTVMIIIGALLNSFRKDTTNSETLK